MEGVTFAHVETINWLPVGYAINKLIDMIPVIKDIKIELKEKDNTSSLLSIFGDTAIMGLILGVIIGCLAGYNWQAVLLLGINLAADFQEEKYI